MTRFGTRKTQRQPFIIVFWWKRNHLYIKTVKMKIWGKERGPGQMEHGIDRRMDRLGNLSIGILQTLPGSLLRAFCSDRNFCIFTNRAKTTCDEPYGSPDTYHAELGHLWWAPRVLTSKSSPFSPDAIQSRPRLEICNYPSGFRIISSSHVSERCKRPIFPSLIKISVKKRKRKKNSDCTFDGTNSLSSKSRGSFLQLVDTDDIYTVWSSSVAT